MENKVKKCKYCGTEMDESAKICPNCKKRQSVSVVKIVLIVLLVLVIIGVIGGSGNDDTNSQNNNNNNSNTQVEDNNSESQPEEKTEYNVGETFSNSFLKLTYQSLNDNFTGYSQYATVNDGCKVISATFEFENLSSTDQLATSFDFTCYADGYNCDGFYFTDDSTFSASLSSGKKATGTVYFQVPVDASDVTIEYETNALTSEKVVFRVK